MLREIQKSSNFRFWIDSMSINFGFCATLRGASGEYNLPVEKSERKSSYMAFSWGI